MNTPCILTVTYSLDNLQHCSFKNGINENVIISCAEITESSSVCYYSLQSESMVANSHKTYFNKILQQWQCLDTICICMKFVGINEHDVEVLMN